jgi:hypothetical protein
VVLLLRRDLHEAVFAVEADRPLGGGPRADEHAALRRAHDVLEQRPADAAALVAGDHVGVADEVDVADGLDAHDPEQRAVVLIGPERHAGRDLALEVGHRHVRLVPAVGGDHAAVGLGGGVDDLEDRVSLVLAAGPDRRHAPHCTGSPIPMSRPLDYGLRQR